MAGDEGSLGHALPCERIAWGDALFTKECIIRFHSEPYLGWDWRRVGASSGAAGDEGSVRVAPLPPIGGAWITSPGEESLQTRRLRGGSARATSHFFIHSSQICLCPLDRSSCSSCASQR